MKNRTPSPCSQDAPHGRPGHLAEVQDFTGIVERRFLATRVGSGDSLADLRCGGASFSWVVSFKRLAASEPGQCLQHASQFRGALVFRCDPNPLTLNAKKN